MNDLQQRLTELGTTLDVPPGPDLVEAVSARLTPRTARRRRRRGGRMLVVTLGFAVLLAGTALAVPPLRHAIERVLDLQSASVQRVPRLLPLPAGRSLALGRRIPVAHARYAASFRALLPPTLPAAAFLSRDVAGGRISLLSASLLLTEFRGQSVPYMLKLIGPGTTAQQVRVNGGPGLYLSGVPHEVLFQDIHGNVRPDTIRLAGNVLLWQQGPLIIRIENTATLTSALRLARSLR